MYASLMPDLIAIQAEPPEAIGIARDAGFAGLDIRFNKHLKAVQDFGVASFGKAMKDAGLRPGYSSLTAQKIGVSDEEWKAEMAELPERAAVARELGYERATSVVLPFSESLDWEANTAFHVGRIREACDVLADFGIAFGVEYVSPATRRKGQKHEFVHTLEQALELLKHVDRPNAGLMLDCFHWACAGETEAQLAALDPKLIVAVHMNDLVPDRAMEEQTVMERLLPGESGLVDMGGFLRGLRDCGYTGPLSAEPTNPIWKETPAEEAAKRTADSINTCLRNILGPDAAAASENNR